MNQNLIAPCGINCGQCLHFLRPQNKCPGCFSGRKVNGKCIKCGIKLCQNRKGEYCFDCEQFPCDRLKCLDNRYREKYGISEIENLINLKKQGIKKFMAHEQQKWVNSEGILCVHDQKRYR